MKNLFNLTLATCAFAIVASLGACSSDDDSTGTAVKFEVDGSVDGTAVLEAYADEVVIARYENLADASGALYTAVNAISSDTDVSGISAAADAWVATRLAWERTEAYLFGPVDLYKVDPGIDSWPLALADLAEFIGSNPSAATILNDNGEKKGFHTIEFLLFDNGSAKTQLSDFELTDLSGSLGSDANDDASQLATYEADLDALGFDKVKAFLVSITAELYRNTSRLVAEWDSMDNTYVQAAVSALPSDYAPSTNNGGGYRDDFVSAGDDESSYSALSDALSVILESAAGIADEVGTVKINDPYVSKNVLDVESWFSHNSVIDFTDNIVGIKEAYYGAISSDKSVTISGTTVTLNNPSLTAGANSISAYVASGSASLDAEVKAAIEAAIVAVAALDYPFRNNLSSSTIEPAMEACAALVEALESAQMAVNDGFYIE